MEFQYYNTVHHSGALFYVSGNGNSAYTVIGGCVFAISRPSRNRNEDSVGNIIKFGLLLKGQKIGNKTLAEYVDSELRRRSIKRKSIDSGEALLIDSLDMMNCDPSCSDRDLCGHCDVIIRDPLVAEYIVSESVSSGLVVTAVRDNEKTRTLQLLENPIISNAYSGFIYDVDPAAFDLVQMPVLNPSPTLSSLLETLFDGIPSTRAHLKDTDVPDREDIVVTCATSAKTALYGPVIRDSVRHKSVLRMESRESEKLPTFATKTIIGSDIDEYVNERTLEVALAKDRQRSRMKKNAKICTFVQVKYIPPILDIWIPSDRHLGSLSITPRKNLGVIWSAFCRISGILDLNAEPQCEMPDELYDARRKISEAAQAVFGNRCSQFIMSQTPIMLTVSQKFLLFQYVQSLHRLPNCFNYMIDLCNLDCQDPDLYADPPINRDLISDLIIQMFRGCAFMGAASEIIAAADHRSEAFLQRRITSAPKSDSCMDADLLLNTVEEITGCFSVNIERNARMTKLAKLLEGIYNGDPLILLAAKESRYLGNSILLCAAREVTATCAFERCERMAKLCVYASVLVDSRLKDSDIPSYYG